MSGLGLHRIFELSLLVAAISAASTLLFGAALLVSKWHSNRDDVRRPVSRTHLALTISGAVFCVAACLTWLTGHSELTRRLDPEHPVRAALHLFLEPAETFVNGFHEQYHMRQLASLEPIDAHTHITATSPELLALLQQMHMHVLDIAYVDDTTTPPATLEVVRRDTWAFVKSSHGQAAFCTTFDPFLVGKPEFPQHAVQELNDDFADGAVAVKVWKNIGLEIRNPAGQYVLPDDAMLAPVYSDIAQHNKTLVIHAAEEDAAWTGQHVSDTVRKYFQNHPQWDMSKRPDAPQKKQILEARDKIVAANPTLRVVGAHFGGMVTRLDDLGALLDRYPNFAVDVSARMRYVTSMPRNDVRKFFIDHQDRILYGTDFRLSAVPSESAAPEVWKRQYLMDYRYLSSNDMVTYNGHPVQGLNLPYDVLRKIYHDNAVRWIPGIIP
jgi:predicted TIM-barrel fold metal-dependent hydrolase